MQKIVLQWGRTFSSAERASLPATFMGVSRASMGPHFFKCGKETHSDLDSDVIVGFNGAALFQVRKVSQDQSLAMLVKGFNGAALFQVRKGHLGRCITETAKSFNGAALFQVRKGQ